MKLLYCVSLLMLALLPAAIGKTPPPNSNTSSSTTTTASPASKDSTTASSGSAVSASSVSTGGPNSATSSATPASTPASTGVTSAANITPTDVTEVIPSNSSDSAMTSASPTTNKNQTHMNVTKESTTTQASATTQGDSHTASTNSTPVPSSPASASSMPNTTTNASSTESVSVTASTTAMISESSTPPVTSPTSSSAPPASDVVISETNLLLATENLFVELRGSANESLQGLSLVVLDGATAEQKWITSFTSSQVFTPEGIYPAESNTDNFNVTSLTSVVVALYNASDYSKSSLSTGLLDFAVFAVSSSATVTPNIQEAMLVEENPLTVVNSSLAMSQNLTLSRCDEGQRNTNLFVPSKRSKGKENPCQLMPNSTLWTLQLHGKSSCQPLGLDDAQRTALEKKLIKEINMLCQCGLTTVLMQSNLTCAHDLLLNFKISGSYTGQVGQVIEAFASYVSEESQLIVSGQDQNFSVVNCITNCGYTVPHHPPGKASKASTTVTVAVVLSCVAVFLIILVAVILYMRGKRRGIIRQFRMTRLQEDDDMDDMDDFIGGGGEPSFSRR